MSNISKLIVSVFSICILAIGVIFLWAQNAKGNDVEIPSISQQSETDDKTSQNEQPRAETPKKRPLLIKKHTHQHAIIDDKTSQNEQLRAETPKKRPLLIKKHTRQHAIPKKTGAAPSCQ